MQFWEKAIKGGSSESFAGFGWYAEIPGLDDVTWNRLTRQTLAITRGRTDWARRVAERAARQQPTPDTLEILNQLLRGIPDYWEQRVVPAPRTRWPSSGMLSAPAWQSVRIGAAWRCSGIARLLTDRRVPDLPTRSWSVRVAL